MVFAESGRAEAIREAKSYPPLWRTVEKEGGATLRQLVDDACGYQAPAVREFLLDEAVRLNRADGPNELISKGPGDCIALLRKERAAAWRLNE